MNNSKNKDLVRAQLESLANSLIRGGLRSNDPELLIIGNGLITLLSATQDERSRQEITRLLMQFCVKQVKLESGMSESEIEIENLLRDTGIHLN